MAKQTEQNKDFNSQSSQKDSQQNLKDQRSSAVGGSATPSSTSTGMRGAGSETDPSHMNKQMNKK